MKKYFIAIVISAAALFGLPVQAAPLASSNAAVKAEGAQSAVTKVWYHHRAYHRVRHAASWRHHRRIHYRAFHRPVWRHAHVRRYRIVYVRPAVSPGFWFNPFFWTSPVVTQSRPVAYYRPVVVRPVVVRPVLWSPIGFLFW